MIHGTTLFHFFTSQKQICELPENILHSCLSYLLRLEKIRFKHSILLSIELQVYLKLTPNI